MSRVRCCVPRLLLAFASTGCASNQWLFHAGPRPPELLGDWIEPRQATASDTVGWVLGAHGDFGLLHVRIVSDGTGGIRTEREERRDGSWYVAGTMRDTVRRALCFKARPRDGGTCHAFRLDSLDGHAPRRRLTVLGYPGAPPAAPRVLVQRLPP